MAEDDERRSGRDEYAMGRLLALSDGVFAIAMTLLVLTIPLPQVASPGNDAVLAALRRTEPSLVSFALSFVLVGAYWMAHRRQLQDVARSSAALSWLNLAMLLLVCLMPFTAGILSRYGFLAVAAIAYATNLTLLGLLMVLLRVAAWHGDLLSPRPLRHEYRVSLARGLMRAGVFAVSMPIALRSVTWAEFFWLTLLPIGLITDRLLRRPARQPADGIE